MTDASATYRLVDLEHMGQKESVAACLLDTDRGPIVIDPGPASTLPRLRAGLARQGRTLADLSAILLTHIHLDHAGATGTIARENPGVRVYVHQSGGTHLVDPAKLLSSATRLYGSRMEELWGEFAAVPAERVTSLTGGESLALGGRRFEVAHTPGHASHHVSYFEPASGTAFVGDTAGLRTPRLNLVFPVTPPPDFDLEAWLDSIRRILAWRPKEIVLTHYGPSHDPATHFAELAAGLTAWADSARESLNLPGGDADQIAWFVGRLTEWIGGRVPPDRARRFLDGAGPEACWHGLARYWRKRVTAAPEA